MAKRRTPQLNAPSPAVAGARRQQAHSESVVASSTAVDRASQNSPGEGCDQWSGPGAVLRGLISLAIMLHGLCLLLAVSSNLAPSYLQGRLLDVAGPYLHVTHQYYRALPLELTRAEPLDFPLRVELQAEATGSDSEQGGAEWQPLLLTGLFESHRIQGNPSDSRWYNLARWLTLISSADPESEILSDFAAQTVQLAEIQSGQRYQAVRFISAKVLSYDEDLALAGNPRASEDETFQPSVMYSARIVRLDRPAAAGEGGSSGLSLVPAQDALRTAKPIDAVKELP